ncbi:aminotransferase class IV [bacterium]|nr:aminotransferase class IV [bacterium]
MHISINGKIVDPKDATISVLNRGFLFGEGLFETLRSYKGKIPFLEKHLNRMEWGTTFIGIPFPHAAGIRKSVEDLLKKSELQDARIKIILSSVGETFTASLPTDELESNLVIFVDAVKPLSPSEYKDGVELVFIHSVFNDLPPVSSMKSLSWVSKMAARRELLERDAYDGIMMNEKGQVCETTIGNIFWVKKGVLFTPPQAVGLLGGITRHEVMDIAKKEGIEVREGIITEAELKTVDEVFMTNSLIEVLPVTKIDEEPIASGKPGKITKELMEGYKKRVEAES